MLYWPGFPASTVESLPKHLLNTPVSDPARTRVIKKGKTQFLTSSCSQSCLEMESRRDRHMSILTLGGSLKKEVCVLRKSRAWLSGKDNDPQPALGIQARECQLEGAWTACTAWAEKGQF